MTALTNAEMVPAAEAQEYARERRDALPALHSMLSVLDWPLPPRFSEEERIFVRLTDKWLTLSEHIAAAKIDRTLLPVLWQETRDANVPREGLWMERVRHWMASLGGSVAVAITGFAVGALQGVIETLVLAFTHLAVVFVPGLPS